MKVVEIRMKRARISEPCDGWVSIESKGGEQIIKLDKGTTNLDMAPMMREEEQKVQRALVNILRIKFHFNILN